MQHTGSLLALASLLVGALLAALLQQHQVRAIATINIWKHRYPLYGGGGYYPYWGGYGFGGGYGGGYGGISLGGYGGGYGR